MMKVLCIDDEKKTVKHMVSLCRKTEGISEATGFSAGLKALSWLEDNPCDLVFLSISPETDGIQLARRIRDIQPETEIIFMTGYPQYAVDAWAIHASGYMMKPVTQERLQEEVNHIRSARAERKTRGGG